MAMSFPEVIPGKSAERPVKPESGQRVLTLVTTGEGESYRFGTYLGSEPYPGIGATDATAAGDYVAWGNKGTVVPKIRLDDGDRVLWGPECWWWPVTAEQEQALRRGYLRSGL